jgi:hypothetical protein
MFARRSRLEVAHDSRSPKLQDQAGAPRGVHPVLRDARGAGAAQPWNEILGPLLDLENPNKFVWLRSFPSLDERERMRNTFYEGPLWKNELEAIAMPLLESYDVILCETSRGYVFDGPREQS